MRRNKVPNQIYAAIIVLFGLAAYANSQQQFSKPLGDTLYIKDVVQSALSNNDQATAARLMEQSAMKKTGYEGAWDDPMLMVGVVNLPTSFDFKEDMMTMKMIGVSQNIPYSGYKWFQSKAAKAQAQVSRQDRFGIELALAAAAKTAFYELYYRQSILADLIGQKDLGAQVVATVAAKLRSDQANQADFEAAQADQWRLESQILSAQQDVDAAVLNLFAIMGRKSDTTIPNLAVPLAAATTPAQVAIPDTPDEWLSQAQSYYPPLQRLKWQSKSYAYQATSSRRMRWPMFGLSANYGFREDSPMEKRDDMVGFEATFSVPIFSWHAQGQMAASMKAMKLEAEAESRQLWREVEANLRALHKRAIRLSQSMSLYKDKIIPADENAFQSALAGMAANSVPLAKLLNYYSTIYKDHIVYNQTSLELARTIIEIERYTTDPEKLAGLQNK